MAKQQGEFIKRDGTTSNEYDEYPDQRHGRSPLPWRQGQSVGRTIYDVEDRLIGVMDTVEDAALVVSMVNKYSQHSQHLTYVDDPDFVLPWNEDP